MDNTNYWGLYIQQQYSIYIDHVQNSNDKSLKLPELIVHEATHWLQDISTPYGLYCHYSEDQMTVILRKIIKDIWKPSERLKLPLTRNKYFTDSHLIQVSTFSYIKSLLLGTRIETIETAINNMRTHNRIYNDIGGEFWSKDHIMMNSNLSQSSSPPLTKKIHLGADDIIEGHARSIEDMFTIMSIANGDIIDPNWKPLCKSRWYGEYSLALDYFTYITGWKNSNECSLDEVYTNLYIFSLLCELALFTPIAPFFNELWNDKSSWEDYHPGWRFVKVCNLLSKPGSPYLQIDNEDSILTFQKYICDYFNWETPNKMLDMFLKPKNKSPYVDLFTYSINIRKKIPLALVNPFIPRGFPNSSYDKDKYFSFYEKLPPPFIKTPSETYTRDIHYLDNEGKYNSITKGLRLSSAMNAVCTSIINGNYWPAGYSDDEVKNSVSILFKREISDFEWI